MDGANLDLNASITKIGQNMIVTLSDNMTDERIHEISNIIIEQTHRTGAKGVVLNFAMVSMIDSYIYQTFEATSRATALFGAKVVWVGLNPGVVCSLIDLGVEPNENVMHTAMSLEQGLAVLAEMEAK